MKLKSIGTKLTASAGATSRSKGVSRKGIRKYPFLALCVRNDGVEASLEKGKAYRVIKPLANDPAAMVRVIDEDHDDYLFPAVWFVRIEVPPAARKNVWRAVSVA